MSAALLPGGNSISAEQLIPAEAQQALEALRGRDDASRWAIGDLTAALVDELARPGVTKRDIRAAVADLAGLTPATVRQYEACAEFYVPARRRYYDVLTWTYFRTAMVSADPDGLLERCLTSADDFGGKVAPVRVLRAWVAAERAGPVPPTWDELHARAVSAVRALSAAADREPRRSQVAAVLAGLERIT